MVATVVVTGALGLAGRWIVDSLRTENEAVAVDQRLPDSLDVEGVHFQATDLTEQGKAWETVLDANPEKVIHLTNNPHEENHPGGQVFENNALTTYWWP